MIILSPKNRNSGGVVKGHPKINLTAKLYFSIRVAHSVEKTFEKKTFAYGPK